MPTGVQAPRRRIGPPTTAHAPEFQCLRCARGSRKRAQTESLAFRWFVLFFVLVFRFSGHVMSPLLSSALLVSAALTAFFLLALTLRAPTLGTAASLYFVV